MTDRELDILAAEKIMGWSDGPHTMYYWADRKKRERPRHGAFHSVPGDPMGDYSTFVNEEGVKFQYGRIKRVHFPPRYHANLDDAFDLVEKLSDRFRVTIENYSDGWYVRFTERVPAGGGRSRVFKAHQMESLPRAILDAALRVAGVEL